MSETQCLLIKKPAITDVMNTINLIIIVESILNSSFSRKIIFVKIMINIFLVTNPQKLD